jgi:signal transduction histidine kinase
MSTHLEPLAPVASPSARRSLAEFLRRNRQRVLLEWEQALGLVPAAALLDRKELREHMPALMDRLQELAEVPEASEAADLHGRHAVERLREGFSLEQVAWEYTALRSVLLRLCDQEGGKLGPGALVLLNDAIDQAVVRAVSKYHSARVRMLEALDRIAREGLLAEPHPLDALMHRLLGVILSCADAVDTAVLLLCEGDALVMRAAVGLEHELESRFILRIGEGFAGTVARTREPLFTPSAETDPLVANPLLHLKGVKALYGLPLVYGDELIGVAKMGSRTVSDFPAEDRLILRGAAERAAAFIAHKRMAEERELFLHVLGHDLRSPLNGVVLHTHVLRRQEHSPEAGRTIDRVLSAAGRMDRLIGDMTDFTQTRMTGTLPLKREKVDLGDLLEQVLLENKARGGGELRLVRVGDVTGEWDRERLVRLVVNLVRNAFAYGDPSTPVDLHVEGENGSVVLRVHNEGPPIPQAVRAHLFEAFRRGGEGAGTGLGLYIVQQTAHAHGGQVDVDSAEGRGTTFCVRLPRRLER